MGETNRLDENALEILRTLAYLHGRPESGNRGIGWASPMYFGGTDGSHHSVTAARLTKMGLVERDKLGIGARGSYRYRITEAGLAALSAPHPTREAGNE